MVWNCQSAETPPPPYPSAYMLPGRDAGFGRGAVTRAAVTCPKFGDELR